MLRIILFHFTSLICFWSYGQITLEVSDQTFKISKEHSIFLGFAAGDEIIFSFKEVNGKNLTEIEITEYPSNSKYLTFKTSEVVEKKIKVSRDAVYEFKFKNGGIKDKICEVKIYRVPSNEESSKFNTSIAWIEKIDTAWNTYSKDIIIGYDTTDVLQTKKVLISSDTIINELVNSNTKVNSALTTSSQYEYINVNLPSNSYFPNTFNPYSSTELISWAYWIGVGQKSKEEFENENNEMKDILKGAAALSGYGLLANLAINGVSRYNSSQSGENVKYQFLFSKDNQNYILDNGNVTSVNKQIKDFLQGGFTIELYNDNTLDDIIVNVKIVTFQIKKTWEDQEYSVEKLIPIKENKLFKDPIISIKKIPVLQNY